MCNETMSECWNEVELDFQSICVYTDTMISLSVDIESVEALI